MRQRILITSTKPATRQSQHAIGVAQRPDALPDISRVDFADAAQVCGYAHLLMSTARDHGVFTGTCPARLLYALRTAASQWLATTERTIADHTAADRLQILSWHDTLHRLAYGRAAEAAHLADQYRDVLKAIAKGEIADRLPIARRMQGLLDTDPRQLSATDLSWYTRTVDRWIREAKAPRPLAGHPADEALCIATFLCSIDLYIWMPDHCDFQLTLLRHFLPRLRPLLSIAAADIASDATATEGSTTGAFAPEGIAYDATATEGSFINGSNTDNCRVGEMSVSHLEALMALAVTASSYGEPIDCHVIRIAALRRLSTDATLDPFTRRAYLLDLRHETLTAR